ncbi:MAG: acyl carrier protein [Acidobacteriota bacterium]
MTDDSILAKICSHLKEIVPSDDLTIGPETELRAGLGLNSLDAVDLVMALEEEFDIELPDEELQGFETVADVAAAVRRQVATS